MTILGIDTSVDQLDELFSLRRTQLTYRYPALKASSVEGLASEFSKTPNPSKGILCPEDRVTVESIVKAIYDLDIVVRECARDERKGGDCLGGLYEPALIYIPLV